MQPRAEIFAALGVVGRCRDQGIRREADPLEIGAMELADRNAETARVAADLVERKERHVPVEERVLQPFRHDGSGHLLEPAPEPADEVRIRDRLRREREVG